MDGKPKALESHADQEEQDPIGYHFSTIGIGDVFLTKPPHDFPSSYLRSTNEKSFVSWETLGKLKEEPEDFVVREIGESCRKLHGVSECEAESILVADVNDNEPLHFPLSQEAMVADIDATVKADALDNPAEPPPATQSDCEKYSKEDLVELLREHTTPEPPRSIEESVARLDSLEDEMKQQLKSTTSDSKLTLEKICLPIFNSSAPKAARVSIHRAISMTYSLLKSDTEKKSDTDMRYRVVVSTDSCFFCLIPYLEHAYDSIISLQLFCKNGYVEPTNEYARDTKRRKRHPSSSSEEGDPKGKVVLTLKNGLSKEERRKVHNLIGAKSKNRLGSSTVQSSDRTSSTTVAVYWRRRSEKGRKRQKIDKAISSNVLLFVLRKRQWEHLTALQIVSKSIGCSLSSISSAGMKDMQAVTYQFLSARGVSVDQVHKARPVLKAKGLHIGRVHKVDSSLKSGDLQGNRFEIRVRNFSRIAVSWNDNKAVESVVECEPNHVAMRVDAVRDHGFINFYGEQRVGDVGPMSIVGVRSYEIGKALLRNDLRSAVNLIMSGRTTFRGGEIEREDILKVRQTWLESDGDPSATWKALPRRNCLNRERLILKGLKRHGKSNYEEAMLCVPHQQRSFWVNAYQSYVWNNMATKRIELFGSKPVIGDLVSKGSSISIFNGEAGVSIYDIVLPLVGSDSEYPKHEIGDLFTEMLKHDCVSFSGKIDGCAPKGSYRAIAAKVGHFSFDMESESVVKFQFDLPKGCYATMMFRELMLTTLSRNTS